MNKSSQDDNMNSNQKYNATSISDLKRIFEEKAKKNIEEKRKILEEVNAKKQNRPSLESETPRSNIQSDFQIFEKDECPPLQNNFFIKNDKQKQSQAKTLDNEPKILTKTIEKQSEKHVKFGFYQNQQQNQNQGTQNLAKTYQQAITTNYNKQNTEPIRHLSFKDDSGKKSENSSFIIQKESKNGFNYIKENHQNQLNQFELIRQQLIQSEERSQEQKKQHDNNNMSSQPQSEKFEDVELDTSISQFTLEINNHIESNKENTLVYGQSSRINELKSENLQIEKLTLNSLDLKMNRNIVHDQKCIIPQEEQEMKIFLNERVSKDQIVDDDKKKQVLINKYKQKEANVLKKINFNILFDKYTRVFQQPLSKVK
ncbi:UNKNOWN [Stylonychia lemnae]|uniref:Uncharacterized protein n=1 Tax=Stylonychia lemnae TaxID=5949 RepID=A0A078AM00_STYLE|nr:UNKNOWN [Stylonychia lemnae]|eukprot:CDW83259.1 UNKNOWN [Stylonychia lemnae]